MEEEELEDIEKLDIDLQDVDELDMGLEVISYKVRKAMQCFSNTILDLQSQNKKLQSQIDKVREILPLDLAIYFHETYERLAPSFGYETREETKQFENNSKNGMLMVAVCEVILNKLLQILNKEKQND